MNECECECVREWWRLEKGRRRREAERGSPVKKGKWYENEVLCLQPISTNNGLCNKCVL